MGAQIRVRTEAVAECVTCIVRPKCHMHGQMISADTHDQLSCGHFHPITATTTATITTTVYVTTRRSADALTECSVVVLQKGAHHHYSHSVFLFLLTFSGSSPS